MGQKVHPNSLRVGFIHNWKSLWFFKNKSQTAVFVAEDAKIRAFIQKKHKASLITEILIERKSQKLLIKIFSARTGVLVGRGGQNLDKLRSELSLLVNKSDIQLDILEVAKPDCNAQYISETIAMQLEKRVAYRRALKAAIQKAMKAGAQGVKIMISGRLGGAEIARTEWSKEGRIPLHTFRADIEYGFSEAMTVFGIIGVKCWVCKGEILNLKTLSTPGVKDPNEKLSQRNQPGRRPKRSF